MNTDVVRRQLFMSLPTLRELDYNTVLDSFLQTHKVIGVKSIHTLNLDTYDNANRKIALLDSISEIDTIWLNDKKLYRVSQEEFFSGSKLGYYINEDRYLYFNFDIYTGDVVKLNCKKHLGALTDFEDKWIPVCIQYCLKELYKTKIYRDAELYAIANADYLTMKRVVGGSSRTYNRMEFMGRAL